MAQEKPKHVFVVFLESFAGWVQDIDDGRFGKLVTPRFDALSKQGLYFTNYYQSGAGTIDNICRAVLQIPLPNAFPASTQVTASFQKFESSLPAVAGKLGYEPSFYYGGSIGWHNLDYFLARAGFSGVYSESDVVGVERAPFGVFDEDLFDFALQKVVAADRPTLSFIMTLSNHPPFKAPSKFSPLRGLTVPPVIQDRLTDKGYFDDRYMMHHYSDHALGAFIDKVEKSPLKDEALFLITSDHSHEGAFRWQPEEFDRLKRIPS